MDFEDLRKKLKRLEEEKDLLNKEAVFAGESAPKQWGERIDRLTNEISDLRSRIEESNSNNSTAKQHKRSIVMWLLVLFGVAIAILGIQYLLIGRLSSRDRTTMGTDSVAVFFDFPNHISNKSDFKIECNVHRKIDDVNSITVALERPSHDFKVKPSYYTFDLKKTVEDNCTFEVFYDRNSSSSFSFLYGLVRREKFVAKLRDDKNKELCSTCFLFRVNELLTFVIAVLTTIGGTAILLIYGIKNRLGKLFKEKISVLINNFLGKGLAQREYIQK
jgi:hypothetical protein